MKFVHLLCLIVESVAFVAVIFIFLAADTTWLTRQHLLLITTVGHDQQQTNQENSWNTQGMHSCVYEVDCCFCCVCCGTLRVFGGGNDGNKTASFATILSQKCQNPQQMRLGFLIYLVGCYPSAFCLLVLCLLPSCSDFGVKRCRHSSYATLQTSQTTKLQSLMSLFHNRINN
jgi:hypothetical protein